MMVGKAIWKIVTAGTLALSIGAGAAYALTPAEAIKARQDCMKANGAMMKVMVPIIKGEAAYDKAAIDAALAAEGAACAGWADWWGEDTKPGGAVETYAKEEIWTDKAGFEAAGMAYGKASEAVKASTDEASFKAAFPALGASCQGCHEKFRKPKG